MHDQLVREINALGLKWHQAGSMTSATLEALAQELSQRSVDLSVETGTGRTTLLFSHFSRRHVTFTKDDDPGDNSLSRVRESPLLNSKTVEFVLGRTQETVLEHKFAPIDVACLDGPHAYPFPELEYWAIYPHLRTGALLVVDDLQVPTIGNMWDVLRADRMFEVARVVDNTGFLQRTDAPTLDPFGDNWQDQQYNRGVHTRHLRTARARFLALARNRLSREVERFRSR